MYTKVALGVLLAGTTLAAQKAPDDGDGATSLPALESFSVARNDDRSWLIVDVQPVRPNGSKVRFIQVHRACGSTRVHETDHVFENVSVRQLAKDLDLCASDQTVAGTISSFKRKQAESRLYPEQGVAAQCGVLYPQMALIAHIHGETSIELSVDVDSVVVKAATAKSGHPILLQSAIDSAKRWVFI